MLLRAVATRPGSPRSLLDLSAPSVGVVGLGYLGVALAERLLGAGHSVHCHNRTREKAEPLLERGAKWSGNPFESAEVIVVCLYTAEIVREVLGGLSPAFREGQTVVDATTAGPDDAAAIGSWLAEAGVAYVEAPVAASSEQTRRGDAVAFLGGAEETIDRVRPVLDALFRDAHHVGPWGAAAKFKLVNNLILGLNRAALAEGLAFADTLDLDLPRTLAILRRCNAYSGVMDTKGDKMTGGDYTPQARLTQHMKDVRIILDEARARGLELPLSDRHYALLQRGEELGFGDLDNSAILKVIASQSAEAPTS